VGVGSAIEIRDYGQIFLSPDEQVTFACESGAEYDVVRKRWGFYATPSINGRLEQFGLRAALVKNGSGRFYLLFCERGMEVGFEQYLRQEQQSLIVWLDGKALREIETLFQINPVRSTDQKP
jgi:hypothetical protein